MGFSCPTPVAQGFVECVDPQVLGYVCSLCFLVVVDKNLTFSNLWKLHGMCERWYKIINVLLIGTVFPLKL